MTIRKIKRIVSLLSLIILCLLFKDCEETWYTDDRNFQTWEYFTTQSGLGSDSVTCLAEDKQGNIWIGTLDNGVSKFDGKVWTIYNEEDGLKSNQVLCIIQDMYGRMVFGTGNGLSFFSNGTWTQDTSFGIVYALLKDYYDHIWVSSENYLVLEWDLQRWVSWYVEGCVGCNYVDVIYEDRQRNIWFGAWDGLRKITSGESTYYNVFNGFPRPFVSSIYQDYWGDLWIGVSWAPYVIRYRNGNFEEISLSNGSPSNIITSISSDNEGNLWFGEETRGAIKFNGSLMKTHTVKDGLPGNNITAILKDKAGYLWFGTLDRGVARYMPGLD